MNFLLLLLSAAIYFLLLLLSLRVLHCYFNRDNWEFQAGAILAGILVYFAVNLILGPGIAKRLIREWLWLYIFITIGAVFFYDYWQAR